MIIILNAPKFKYQKEPIAVTLGNFDGLHMGHQVLINRLVEISKREKIKNMVFTFFNHPMQIISPESINDRITDNRKRIKIFNDSDVDYVYLKRFDEQILRLSPKQFVTDILQKTLNIKYIVVGYNYTYGYRGEGTAETLKDLGKEYGFDVVVVPPVKINNSIVSSTLIRNLVSKGSVEKVKDYLGRFLSLEGIVIHGDARGRKIGMPTANIKQDEYQMLPLIGVYATQLIHKNKSYRSVTNIGLVPTFDKKSLSIETHIIDFCDDIYGERVSLEFVKRIRPEIRFEGHEKLYLQIREDILEAERIFAYIT